MSTPEQQQALLNALFELSRPTPPPIPLNLDGLTRGEFYLLNVLHEHSLQFPQAKGMYVSELHGQMRVTPPAVSRMLRGMEEKGYIERVVDRSDRRTTYIVLSPKSVQLRKECETRALSFTGRIIDEMGGENVEQLLTLLRNLRDIAHRELAKENASTC